MVSLTSMSVSTDDETSDDDGPLVEEASDGGGGQKSKRHCNCQGSRKKVLEGPCR